MLLKRSGTDNWLETEKWKWCRKRVEWKFPGKQRGFWGTIFPILLCILSPNFIHLLLLSNSLIPLPRGTPRVYMPLYKYKRSINRAWEVNWLICNNNKKRRNSCSEWEEDQNMENMPPGYRFYPTEQEIITFYLRNKLEGQKEHMNRVIPVLNIYDYNPSQLPRTYNNNLI